MILTNQELAAQSSFDASSNFTQTLGHSMPPTQKIEFLRLALLLHEGRGASDDDILQTAKRFHDFVGDKE